MKKTKILVLAVMSALTLVGCGGGNSTPSGELPSGGTEVDLKDETNKATLKSCLANTRDAYKEELTSVSLKSNTTGGLVLDAKAVTGLGDIALKLDAKDLKAESNVVLAKSEKGNVDASAKVSTTGGSITLSGSVPKEFDSTALSYIMAGLPVPEGEKKESVTFSATPIEFKGEEVNAYLSESKLYADYSSSKNERLVKNLDVTLNSVYEQLRDRGSALAQLVALLEGQPFYDSKEGFVFSKMYKDLDKKVYTDMGKTVEWPTFEQKEGEQTDDLDKIVDTIVELAKENLGITFKTYKEKSFGFQFALSKESLVAYVKKVAGEMVADIDFDKYLDRLSLNASILFNKNAMLESVGGSIDIAVKYSGVPDIGGDYGPLVKMLVSSFDASLELNASSSMTIKYNSGKVKFPSFDGYVEKKVETPAL